MNEFKTVKFPNTGLLFNYFIDPKTKKFALWNENISKYELDLDIPLTVSELKVVNKYRHAVYMILFLYNTILFFNFIFLDLLYSYRRNNEN